MYWIFVLYKICKVCTSYFKLYDLLLLFLSVSEVIDSGTGKGWLDSHKDAGVKWVHFFCGLYRARLIWSRIRIWPWPEGSGCWPEGERSQAGAAGSCTGLNTLECISISWLWLHCRRQTSASAALSGGYAPTCQIKGSRKNGQLGHL